MKQNIIILFFISVILTGCSKTKQQTEAQVQETEKTEQIITQTPEPEAEIISTVIEEEPTVTVPEKIPVTKVELTSEEEIQNIAEEPSIFTDVDIIEYPKEVSLKQEEDTLLYKCSDFSLSMQLKNFKSEDKGFGDYYSYDLFITDSNGSKKVIYSDYQSVYRLNSSKNPIYIYKFLSNNVPVVKGDINNDGKDEFLFTICQLYNDSMLAIQQTDTGYTVILEQNVVVYGGCESDDVAGNILFYTENSIPKITIDYAPYNKRTNLFFDKESNKFICKENQYTSQMEKYKPFLPGKLMHFGNHEILLSGKRDHVYLKQDSDYYKIYFEGDPESRGIYEFELIKDSLKVYDIDEDRFIITMTFVNKDYGTTVPLYKDQVYYIKKQDGILNLTKTFNDRKHGYQHEKAEYMEITDVQVNYGLDKFYFNIVNEETSETVKSDEAFF